MKKIKEYFLLTFSTVLIAVGIYYFRFPNNFSFGGVAGLGVIIKTDFISPSNMVSILNIIILIIGFLFLGKDFGIRTAYVTMLMSVLLWAFERLSPLESPLTSEPMLELLFAIGLPSLGSALLFNINASSGGTDIAAMILRKYTHMEIGISLFIIDLVITLMTLPIYGITTALYSFTGLVIKTLVIDDVIEGINKCKYITVITSSPDRVCNFVMNNLKKTSTVLKALGYYSKEDMFCVVVALYPRQAVMLRDFIRKNDPDAFMLISNTSEIIGKGFRQ